MGSKQNRGRHLFWSTTSLSSLLNRFQTSQGPRQANLHECSLATSDADEVASKDATSGTDSYPPKVNRMITTASNQASSGCCASTICPHCGAEAEIAEHLLLATVGKHSISVGLENPSILQTCLGTAPIC